MNGDTVELPLLDVAVDPAWLDYNGHMTESRYVYVFGEAVDALYRRIGMDDGYRARARASIYTVECFVRYLKEASVGQTLHVTGQVLGLDDKRLRLFARMREGVDGPLLATAEFLCLHVATDPAKARPFPEELLAPLQTLRDAHAELPVPDAAGRAISL